MLLIPLTGLLAASLNDVLQAIFGQFSVYGLLLSGGVDATSPHSLDLVTGLTGGFPSVLCTCFAITATLSVQRRSQRLAVAEGAMGLGGTLGYLGAGLVLR